MYMMCGVVPRTLRHHVPHKITTHTQHGHRRGGGSGDAGAEHTYAQEGGGGGGVRATGGAARAVDASVHTWHQHGKKKKYTQVRTRLSFAPPLLTNKVFKNKKPTQSTAVCVRLRVRSAARALRPSECKGICCSGFRIMHYARYGLSQINAKAKVKVKVSRIACAPKTYSCINNLKRELRRSNAQHTHTIRSGMVPDVQKGRCCAFDRLRGRNIRARSLKARAPHATRPSRGHGHGRGGTTLPQQPRTVDVTPDRAFAWTDVDSSSGESERDGHWVLSRPYNCVF